MGSLAKGCQEGVGFLAKGLVSGSESGLMFRFSVRTVTLEGVQGFDDLNRAEANGVASIQNAEGCCTANKQNRRLATHFHFPETPIGDASFISQIWVEARSSPGKGIGTDGVGRRDLSPQKTAICHSRTRSIISTFGGNPLEGPIAQRLEQGTHNPLVPGSNPGGPILQSVKGER